MRQESENKYRRTYPRKSFRRSVGVLFKGQYFLAHGGEIGEGGISIYTDLVLTEGEPLMVSFQIPNGEFICLRAQVRSIQKTEKPEDGMNIIHGLAFTDIEFATKRQIRSYVSSRAS